MPPDDDIEFDFFDEEPVTAEAPQQQQSRVRLPHRRPREPRDPGDGSAHPLTPVIRLGALVFIGIFIVLVFSLLIASCAGTSKHDVYSNYMDRVATIATQSATDGRQTVTVLTSPGLDAAAIVKRLNNIAAAEQQNVTAAQKLSPPGKLRLEHGNLIQSLQLRVSGVNGLSKAFAKTIGSKGKTDAQAVELSQQAYRLLASDIIWDDLFQTPSEQVLENEGVHGVKVPSSHFLLAPDLIVSQHAMAQILTRIGSGGTGGGTPVGLHGTNIVSTSALPNGAGGTSEVLNEGTLNTVTTSSSLVFQVTIHNGGDSQEVQIPVTLTIGRPQSQGGPITKTEKVQLIDPGTDQSVTFTDLGQVPFASQTTVSVDVAKVPGETNTSNNSASYQVIFSLPS
jgi:hypothetical protein